MKKVNGQPIGKFCIIAFLRFRGESGIIQMTDAIVPKTVVINNKRARTAIPIVIIAERIVHKSITHSIASIKKSLWSSTLIFGLIVWMDFTIQVTSTVKEFIVTIQILKIRDVLKSRSETEFVS